MINKGKLEEVLTNARIVILQRIMLLSKASELMNDITTALLNNESDEYIMALIRNDFAYRNTIIDLDKNWGEIERNIWEALLHIDQSEEGES